MLTRKQALANMRSFVGKPRKAMPWLKKRPNMYDCAAGYSYCATGKVTKYVWVHEMVDLMKKNGTWKKGKPQPGDAVIYDWDHSGDGDHVAMFHSIQKDGRWVSFGADQGHPTPGLVSKLVTGKGLILGWGTPFPYAEETPATPITTKEMTSAVTQAEMPLKPEHYAPADPVVAPAVVAPATSAPVVVVPAKMAYPGKLIKKGSKGTAVKYIQKQLGLTVDGVFGTATSTAVKALQKKHGLTADGIVGPKTWSKLG